MIVNMIVDLVYQILKKKTQLLRYFDLIPKARLRVLLYHHVSVEQEEKFALQMKWLCKSWHFVTPKKFAAMVNGTEKLTKDSLMLCFDDGF